MHLKSLTLKGFKSFPDRTQLDFGPGVSVVVGPNGSGKSNVTDALLWAMGEQSPLAVRGSSMQDVIFGGGRGVQPRSSAEVEIVLDNSDGTVEVPLSEISIVRRLDRSGEGEYRLNGARCRLVDVIEVLSDTGLGKETHSVISQGRVESIVTSKPRERRLLIEEAAGLGKHRKRRRRAQLKLERTQENLDRALDVEREARTRLRPLKRQAEAAQLHERLKRQMLELRLVLAREQSRAFGEQLAQAEAAVSAAREAQEQAQSRLDVVSERRAAAESALGQRAERHDALAQRSYRARSACERIQLRSEQVLATASTLSARVSRVEIELGALERETAGAPGVQPGEERIAELEAELERLQAERERELERELEDLRSEHETLEHGNAGLESELEAAREARRGTDDASERARTQLRTAESQAEAARREAARVGAQLAAANQFLRSHARSLTGAASEGAPRALSEALQVEPGYELALTAVLGGRLDAALVPDLDSANRLLDAAGEDGGAALLALDAGCGATQYTSAASDEDRQRGRGADGRDEPPVPGALALADLVRGERRALELARLLLTDAWVVERLEELPAGFRGVAVTRNGRVMFGLWRELRQLAEGGAERVLARRNERDSLIAASESCAQAEQEAKAAVERALLDCAAADSEGERAEQLLREADRRLAEAVESQRRVLWLIEQRQQSPGQGPDAVRRAELEGELAAERRQAERIGAQRAERDRRIERLRAQRTADVALVPRVKRLSEALVQAGGGVDGVLAQLERLLAADSAEGEQLAGELRECAHEEAEIQAELRARGEQVTGAEVSAQRVRDQVAEAEQELRDVRERLELPPEGDLAEVADGQQAAEDEQHPAPEPRSAEPRPTQELPSGEEPLGEEQEQALRARLERLQRRREQLGPVNPLARDEYGEALTHVEELESRRSDLEAALRELAAVIRETDKQIHETFDRTFAAAARNFEELVGDVFPGGSGRLRLVRDDHAPRPVLGGQSSPAEHAQDGPDVQTEDLADAEAERERDGEEELLGVEIEITPAGKSAKRLSLLSGGEKSMTALAFLFAVFLARPCPFYVLDEVEAALDDLNLDRFLDLLRRYANRAQFIVITHQKRTMEAADWLYGVSMAQDGVSKVLSRRLPREEPVVVAAPAA